MKRLVFLVALTVFLAGGFVLPASVHASEIPVLIDGLPVEFDVNPIIDNGRTLVPFRAISEALAVGVNWDAGTRTINATDGATSVKLQIGNSTAYRNGSAIILDVPPKILDGRTLIPLRFFSEAYGCEVAWDAANTTVRIISPPRDMTVVGFYALGDKQTSSWTDLFGVAYPETAEGNTDIVDELALGWYSLDREGNLLTASTTGWKRPDGWEDVLAATGEYDLGTEMVVHLTDGDGTINALINSDTATARAVGQIVAEGKQYRGINLDFEGLGYNDSGSQLQAVRDGFNNFVQSLAAKAHAAGLELTLSLHAPNSAYKGYDYASLGAAADRIIIMAYDYGPKPEPNSLVIQAVEEAVRDVPANKLLLGISIPSETPESLVSKVGIAKRYQLNGIALWRLGVISDGVWNTLRTMTLVERY